MVRALLAVLPLGASVLARAGEPLGGGAMAVAIVAVTLVPTAATRRPTVMISWEVVLLAGLPVLARSLGFASASSVSLAVAAVALVVAVELDAFTAVEMTPTFAVSLSSSPWPSPACGRSSGTRRTSSSRRRS